MLFFSSITSQYINIHRLLFMLCILCFIIYRPIFARCEENIYPAKTFRFSLEGEKYILFKTNQNKMTIDLLYKNKVLEHISDKGWFVDDGLYGGNITLTQKGSSIFAKQYNDGCNSGASLIYEFIFKSNMLYLVGITDRTYHTFGILHRWNARPINVPIVNLSSKILSSREKFWLSKACHFRSIEWDDSDNKQQQFAVWGRDLLKQSENNKNNFLKNCLSPEISFVSASLSELDSHKSMEIIITQMNNIAFYLYKDKEYKAAVNLLRVILEKAPTRAVAHLNLADAYWDSGKKSEAKASYKSYQKLMQTQGKDLSKIPKYVAERLNSRD